VHGAWLEFFTASKVVDVVLRQALRVGYNAWCCGSAWVLLRQAIVKLVMRRG
jgi:hypothetical protein